MSGALLAAVAASIPAVVTVSGYQLWIWGNNSYGQLGLGDTIDRSSPVQIGSLTNWYTVSSGAAQGITGAITVSGELWTWGGNSYGAAGLGDTINRSSPTQVGALTTWASIAGGRGGRNTLATKTDGTLWSWGYNYGGSLGLNNRIFKSSPTQVGSLTSWQSIGGSVQGSSFGLKTNGTLWAWGYGTQGQLGQNSTGYISSPVQVGALTTWLSISGGYSSIAAIKTDGTLWSWGTNAYGELGLNNLIARSSPTQVGSLTNWATVSSGNYFTVAIKTDGTLWSWGINTKGKLGLNNSNYAYSSSPTQIGALTNWAYSAATRTGGFAIKTTGAIWTWGWNVVGTLGLGDTIDRSSPVQIGSLTNWLRLSAAKYTAGPALRS